MYVIILSLLSILALLSISHFPSNFILSVFLFIYPFTYLYIYLSIYLLIYVGTLVALEDSILWSISNDALHHMYIYDPDLVIVLLQITLTYASHRLHTFTHIGLLHSV